MNLCKILTIFFQESYIINSKSLHIVNPQTFYLSQSKSKNLKTQSKSSLDETPLSQQSKKRQQYTTYIPVIESDYDQLRNVYSDNLLMENTQRNCEQNIESSLHDQPSQFSKNIIIYENIQNQDVSRLDQDPINICQNDKQSRKSSYDNSINEHLRDMREFEMTIDIYKDRQGRDYPSKNISRDLSKIEIKDGLTNLNINNRRLKKSNRDQESSYESINQNIILNGLEDQQKSWGGGKFPAPNIKFFVF